MHTWEGPEINQTQTQNQAKQEDQPNENLEKMPHKPDSNYHKGVTLSLSPPICISARPVLFFLLINTLLASLLSISLWKLISCKAIPARVFSQATGP